VTKGKKIILEKGGTRTAYDLYPQYYARGLVRLIERGEGKAGMIAATGPGFLVVICTRTPFKVSRKQGDGEKKVEGKGVGLDFSGESPSVFSKAQWVGRKAIK